MVYPEAAVVMPERLGFRGGNCKGKLLLHGVAVRIIPLLSLSVVGDITFLNHALLHIFEKLFSGCTCVDGNVGNPS
jgi:hypothetical protein